MYNNFLDEFDNQHRLNFFTAVMPYLNKKSMGNYIKKYC